MTFQYKTEYCLGRRGRVCRTYGGIQALVAIAFDLALGLTFGLVGLGWWLVRRSVLTAYRVAAALVSLPLGAVRAVSVAHPGRVVGKPAWSSLDEL
jgi:hypothetical protein